jgi:16S rRNA (cytidine1402-2'-O)-methyltransferase
MTGTLFLVPNLLGAVAPASVLPARTIEIARNQSHWLVETPKPARAFLKSIGVARPIAELSIRALTDTPAGDADASLAALRAGHDVGLLSDAGCPGVADPGAAIVAAAHAARIRVVPLVGPSAVLLALMAAGMNGQRFAFHGYLPVKVDARADAIRAIEQRSRAETRTELFIETPYRNVAMLDALSRTLQPSTRVCVAADLTLASEIIECRSAALWRREDPARFDRRPAVFLLQASPQPAQQIAAGRTERQSLM